MYMRSQVLQLAHARDGARRADPFDLSHYGWKKVRHLSVGCEWAVFVC